MASIAHFRDVFKNQAAQKKRFIGEYLSAQEAAGTVPAESCE